MIRKALAIASVVVLISCGENSLLPLHPSTPQAIKWEATGVKYEGILLTSFSFDNKLLLATKTSLMSVDADQKLTEVLAFDPTGWDSPDPILNNSIYVCRTLKDTIINGVGGSVSSTVHLNDLKDGAKGTINMTRVLRDVALNKSDSWDFYIAMPLLIEIAAISAKNEIMFLIWDLDDRGLVDYRGIVYSIEKEAGKIILTNRKVFVITDEVQTMEGFFSIGDYFYVTSGDYSYRIDSDGNTKKLKFSIRNKPVYFNNKWNIITPGAYYESTDGYDWTQLDETERHYGDLSLGFYDGKFWYVSGEEYEIQNDIYATADLKEFSDLKLKNDPDNYVRPLQVLDGYVYGRDFRNQIYRIKAE